MRRLILAIAVLVIGVVASTAVSQVKDQICFYQVSCGDKMLPCVCLPDEQPRCRMCTGTAIGNFCFPCPGQTCPAISATLCGYQYTGVCIRRAEGSPRVCVGLVVSESCVATGCR
jgi:hypothetical protein